MRRETASRAVSKRSGGVGESSSLRLRLFDRSGDGIVTAGGRIDTLRSIDDERGEESRRSVEAERDAKG